MAFDSLSEKLQNVFKSLRGKGLLTEDDVRAGMKEVKMALLEADVNFKVVKSFIRDATDRAIGQDVMKGLNPGQMVVKIVNEELVELMGGEPSKIKLLPASEVTVVMMMGLQGAGKTTTTVKLAKLLEKEGRHPLLAACDLYRPAAMEQLRVNASKADISAYIREDGVSPADIAKGAVEEASKTGKNLVILDTAGRLQIDDEMMDELIAIKEAVNVTDAILVVDAMTGQEAVNVAKTFDEKVGIDGVILTKLDGDARGGAALSVRAVTGRPVLYAGMGEKVSDLEIFYPDRMASRILGMGDVMTLIEKASEAIDEEKATQLEQKLLKTQFGFDDFLESMNQMKQMGGLSSILSMMPGLGGGVSADQIEQAMDDKKMAHIEAIIQSMTPKERSSPDIINPSRKKRIADGAGVQVAEVNRLIKQFDQMKKVMKKVNSKGRRGGLMSMFSGMGGRGKGLPF